MYYIFLITKAIYANYGKFGKHRKAKKRKKEIEIKEGRGNGRKEKGRREDGKDR